MKQVFTGLLLLSVAAAFFLGYASNVTLKMATPEPVVLQPIDTPKPPEPESFIVTMKLPAVDKEGKGALAELKVEAREGSGRVFIGFEDSPLINADTQSSLRIALDVARRYAGKGSKFADVSYTFSTQSDVVGGKSAGAAAAIGTIAALKGETLRSDVLITGTVEADGSIGQVGKILEKAKVAKAAGYKTILVPPGEGTQSVAVEECREKREQDSYFRECTSVVKKVGVEREAGMSVVEVPDIPKAYSYFRVG